MAFISAHGISLAPQVGLVNYLQDFVYWYYNCNVSIDSFNSQIVINAPHQDYILGDPNGHESKPIK